jgi:hypothetical protein
MMNRSAPGQCADCGADAYIQLAVRDAMLCAHCYAERLGVRKAVGRKGSEREATTPQLLRRRTG